MAKRRGGEQRSTCTCCRLLLLVLVLGGGGLAAGIYFGVIDKDDIDRLQDNIQDLRNKTEIFLDQLLETDPHTGLNGTVYRWVGNNGQGGLELELLNALEDEWHPFFDQAVVDWNSGTPDALTLTTSRVSVEKDCKQEGGFMKVCAGDYGATGWRGINNYITQNNRIISSSAKMNQFYLNTEGDLYKTYTMCHEIGHGFGLPHTDENFMNPPLGDCLDYTEISISTNLKPGQVNYDKLAAVYGTVGDGRRRRRTTRRTTTQKSERRRILDSIPPEVLLPTWLRTELREKVEVLETDPSRAHRVGWIQEWHDGVSPELGQHFVLEMGDGFAVHASLLLAPPTTEESL